MLFDTYGRHTANQLRMTELNSDTWDEVTQAQLCNRARHVVPARLRIVTYSPNLSFPDYPTIHFEGETGMEVWQDGGATDEDDDRNVCHLEGTVSMLADGSVRWSFVRPFHCL